MLTDRLRFKSNKVGIPRDNLIGEWLGESWVSNLIYDTSGYNNTGTAYNCVKTAGGKVGNYMAFSGASNNSKVIFPAPIIPNTGPHSVSFWYRLKSSTLDCGAIHQCGYLNEKGLMIAASQTTAPFFFMYRWQIGSSWATNFAVTEPATRQLNIWYHVVCTWDGTTNPNGAKLYVDNVLVGQGTSTSATLAWPPAHNMYFIYKSVNYQCARADMDQVRFYGDVVTDEERTALFEEVEAA